MFINGAASGLIRPLVLFNLQACARNTAIIYYLFIFLISAALKVTHMHWLLYSNSVLWERS